MNELLSSVVGAALVLGVAVPVTTLAAKAVLQARWRRNPDPRYQGSLWTFVLLVLPTLGAVGWFISAALHLAEPGAGHAACSIDHATVDGCVDTVLFAALLSGLLVMALVRGWWRDLRDPGARAERLPDGDAHAARLDRLCRAHARLAPLRRHVVAVSGPRPLRTRGLLRPVIEVAARDMDRLDDAALIAALLHEAEHRAARDPLRYLVASAGLALNPVGFLLRPELRRWRAARETVCDEWAVRRSADPLALAEALVTVARPHRPAGGLAAGLAGPDEALLRLRVHLLIDYAAKPPGRPSAAPFWTGFGLAIVIAASPHLFGAWPLDAAHGAVEQALAALGLI